MKTKMKKEKDKIKDRDIQKRWKEIHKISELYDKLMLKQAGVKGGDFGICWNGLKRTPEDLPLCSVGMVRIFRSGNIEGGGGTCKYCPYFLNEEELSKFVWNFELRKKYRKVDLK